MFNNILIHMTCPCSFVFLSSRQYIKKTKLKQIKYKILEFNPMALKGKVKPDTSRPDLLHPVSTYKRDFYTKLK